MRIGISSDAETATSEDVDTDQELEEEEAACAGRNETPRETPERSGADRYVQKVDDSAQPAVEESDVLGDS